MQLPFEKKREIVYKHDCETDWNYGKNPYERSVEELIEYGIINLNKPRNPTSHQVTDFVKKILGIKKAGHSGTLDPKVTGVLPIALNYATRVLEFLQLSAKEYVGIAYFHGDIEIEKIQEAFKEFTGEIVQVPPVRSSVKRRPRKRKVYYFIPLEVNGRWVLFLAGVEHGVYIRKLIHDVGEYLGVGAHMYNLHRTKVGGFKFTQSKTLQDLEDAWMIYKECGIEKYIREVIRPYEEATNHLPKVWVNDKAAGNISYGAQLYSKGICW
jgi:H/ACA ribonucleoprotein complex subunit 4